MREKTILKSQLKEKLKRHLNSFIKQNTFTLKELQLLERNIQPFGLKDYSK